jgi:hypothetical protein
MFMAELYLNGHARTFEAGGACFLGGYVALVLAMAAIGAPSFSRRAR